MSKPNPDSKINRIISALNDDVQENSSIVQAVRLNMHLGNTEYLDEEANKRYTPTFDRENERDYISRFTREYEEKDANSRVTNSTLGRVIGDTISDQAFTSFERASHQVVKDGRNTLKNLTAKFFLSDNETDEFFGSQNVFKYVYEDYLDGTNLVNRNSKNNTAVFDNTAYELGGTAYLKEMGRDHLRSLVNADIAGAFQTIGRIESEIDRLSYTGQGLQAARRILDSHTHYGPNLPDVLAANKEYQKRVAGLDVNGRANIKPYTNRPGVLPFIQLIETANSEIIIDSFQFQNKTVSDVLFDAIKRKTQQNPDFKVTIRLGAPRNSDGTASKGLTGFAILGPNVIEVQKFALLNEQLKDKLGIKEDIINIDTQDKRYHSKLYYTDKAAMIGTANLTSPIGQSINQAGSNFEVMLSFQNMIEMGKNGNDSELAKARSAYNLLSPDDQVDVKDTLIHRQITQLMRDKERPDYDKTSKFIGRKGQLGLAGDIYEHLKSSIDYVHDARGLQGQDGYMNLADGSNNRVSKLSAFFVLDQTWLLQFDDTLYNKQAEGEFGTEDINTQSLFNITSNRATKFRDMQSKLITLISEDRAFVTVDVKNYTEQVYDPIIKKIMGNSKTKAAYEKYGYNLRSLVGENKDDAVMNQRLIDLGFTDPSNRRQLIAMSSGNITLATVPRQHAKMFGVINRNDQNDVSLDSYYAGSSNLGAYSLGMPGQDNSNVSEEYGIMYGKSSITKRRSQSSIHGDTNLATEVADRHNQLNDYRKLILERDYSLSEEMEEEQLKGGLGHINDVWSQLNNTDIRNSQFNKKVMGPLWESSVNDKQLLALKSKIEILRKSIGASENAFTITNKLDANGYKTNSILVSIDIGKISGLGEGVLAPTLGGNTKLQLELTVLKGVNENDPGTVLVVGSNKLISDALFVNSTNKDIFMPYGSKKALGQGRYQELDPNATHHTVKSKESMHLDSADTMMYILGTVIGEGLSKTLVNEPSKIWNKMDADAKQGAVITYLSAMSGVEDLLSNDGQTEDNLRYLAEQLETRFSPDTDITALRNARKFGNIKDSQMVPSNPLYERRREMLTGEDSSGNKTGNIGLSRAITNIVDATTPQAKQAALNNVINLLQSKTMTALFPELVLDIVDKQIGFGDNEGLKDKMFSFFNSLLEPHQMTGQDRTRGGPVDANRLVVLGVNNNETVDRLNSMGFNEGNDSDITNIMGYYRAIGYEYGPTTDVFDYLYRSIASKSSNSTDYSDADYSLINQAARGFGEAFKLELYESLGVGTITNRSQANNYLAEMEKSTQYTPAQKARIRKELLNKFTRTNSSGQTEQLDRVLTFFTGGQDKIAQLPQRLKNAMGARPLYQLSEGAQQAYEAPGGNITKFRNDYQKDKRTALKNKINTLLAAGSISQDQADVALREWFTEESKLGAMFGGKIQKLLSTEQAAFVEAERQKIMDILNLKNEEEFQRDDLAPELLRVNVLLASNRNQRLGRMIGGSDRKGYSIGIVQLSGGYSDHYIANAQYGDTDKVKGMREGYLDSYRKAIKSSLISSFGLDFKYQDQDQIKLDPSTGKYTLFRDGDFVKTHVVKKSGSHDIFVGIENDNYSPNGIDGSIATAQNTAYYRAGEDTIEDVFSSTFRQGGTFETSQLVKQFQLIRTLKQSGGRRVEGTDSASLVKGVAIYASTEQTIPVLITKNGKQETVEMNYFEYLVYQKQQAIDNGEIGGSFSIYKGAGNELDVSQVSGLYNPNNFKSFMFSHGSVILRHENGKMLDKLVGDSSSTDDQKIALAKKAAASILMSFGTDFLESDATKVKSALLDSAGRGELGSHYKMVATLSRLTAKKKSGLTSDEAAADFLLKKSSFNVLSTPDLLAIDSAELIKILESGDVEAATKFLDRVKGMLSTEAGDGNSYMKEYLNIGNSKHRQAITLASGLDFFHQLSNNQTLLNLPTDVDWSDETTLNKIRIIYGISDKDWNDKEERERGTALLRGLFTRASSVMIYADIAASQSKDPTGAHAKGKTEGQYLMRPMLAQINNFNEEGPIGRITNVVASLTAAIAGNSPMQYYGNDAITDMKHIDLMNVHSAGNAFFDSNFLGIYATEINSAEYNALVKEYKAITETQTEEIVKGRKVVKRKRGELIEAYTSGSTTRVKAVEQKLKAIQEKMYRLQSQYGAFEGKTSGTSFASSVVGAMTNQRFSFEMPNLIRVQEGGRTITKVDNSKKTYSFMPSGQDIKTLGLQWGDFVDDFVSNVKEIQRGLAPGTIVSNILNRIRTNPGGVVLTPEEEYHLEKFMVAVQKQTDLMASTIAGARFQSALGGKNSFDGLVSTAVPSWLLKAGSNVLPNNKMSEMDGSLNLDRFESLDNLERKAKSLDIDDQGNSISQRLDQLKKQRAVNRGWEVDRNRRIDLNTPVDYGPDDLWSSPEVIPVTDPRHSGYTDQLADDQAEVLRRTRNMGNTVNKAITSSEMNVQRNMELNRAQFGTPDIQIIGQYDTLVDFPSTDPILKPKSPKPKPVPKAVPEPTAVETRKILVNGQEMGVSTDVLRTGGRDIVLVQTSNGPQLFYRSSGHNSGMANTWLPVDGMSHMNGMQLSGWFDKTAYTTGKDATGRSLTDKKNPLHRFGTEENLLISAELDRLAIEQGIEANLYDVNKFGGIKTVFENAAEIDTFVDYIRPFGADYTEADVEKAYKAWLPADTDWSRKEASRTKNTIPVNDLNTALLDLDDPWLTDAEDDNKINFKNKRTKKKGDKTVYPVSQDPWLETDTVKQTQSIVPDTNNKVIDIIPGNNAINTKIIDIVPSDKGVIYDVPGGEWHRGMSPEDDQLYNDFLDNTESEYQKVKDKHTIIFGRNKKSSNIKKFLSSQQKAIIQGFTVKVVPQLDQLKDYNDGINAQLKNLENISDPKVRQQQIEILTKELTDRRTKFGKLTVDGEGDTFFKNLALKDTEIWLAKLYITRAKLDPSFGTTRRLDYFNTLVNEYASVPLMLQGFHNFGSGSMVAVGLENKITGKLHNEQYSITNLKNVLTQLDSPAQKLDYLQKKIDSITKEFNNYLLKEKADNVNRGMTNEDYEILYEDEITNLKQAVRKLKDIKTNIEVARSSKVQVDYKDTIDEIERIIVKHDKRGATQNLTFRSAPAGGTEFQLHSFKATTLSALNYYGKDLQKKVNKHKGVFVMQYSEERNQAASLLNPVGFISTDGGDFDGDPYTTIMKYLAGYANQISYKRDDIEVRRIKVKNYREQLKDPNQILTEKEKTELRILLREEIGAIKDAGEKIQELGQHVNRVREKTVTNYSSAARKEFANYMGVDERMFIEKGDPNDPNSQRDSRGRTGWAEQTADVDALFSYMPNARDLYGGIKDKADDSFSVSRAVESLVDFNMNSKNMTEGFVKIQAQTRLATLNPNDKSTALEYETLTRIVNNDNLARNVASLLGIVGSELDNIKDLDEKKERLRDFVGSEMGRMFGQEEMAGIMAKGSGATINDSTFDSLLKSLGTAGGDLLGKSYNSLIGTLHADSPFISLSELVRNEKTENSVIKHIDDLHAKGAVTFTGVDFTRTLKESIQYSEGLQGYVKNIHQLLRDSIKLKSDSTDVAAELEALADKYKQSDNEIDKKAIILQMANNIGPGMGIIGLTRLDELVKSEDGINKEKLNNVFGIDTEGNTGNYFRIAKRIGIDYEEANDARLQPNSEYGNDIFTKIARFSTSEDLVSLVGSYALDRHLASGKAWSSTIVAGVKSRYADENNTLNRVDSDSKLEAQLKSHYLDGGDWNDSEADSRRQFLSKHLGIGNDVYEYDQDNNIKGFSQGYKDKVNALVADKGDAVLYMAEQAFYASREQSRPLLKDDGSGLEGFTNTERTRTNLAQSFAGADSQDPNYLKVRAGLDDNMSDVELLHTFQQLASQGKLDTLGATEMAQMYAGVIRRLGLSADSTEEDILKVLYSKERPSTNAAAKQLQGYLGEIFNADASGTHKLGDEVKFNTLGGMISSILKGTVTGQNSASIQDYLTTWHKSSYGIDNPVTEDELVNIKVVQGDMNDADYAKAKNNFRTTYRELKAEKVQAVHQEVADHKAQGYRNATRGSLAGKLSEGQINALKDNNKSNLLEFFIPLALTLVGGAVSSGGADPQAIQQLVGSSLSALAYTRGSIINTNGKLVRGGVSKGAILGGALASTMKLRGALVNNEGDIGAAVQEVFVREAVIGLTNAIVAPVATELVTNHVFRINKNALDSDRYLASKTLAGSAVGAVLSAFAGFFLSNYAVSAVRQKKQITGAGIVEATLDSASTRIQAARAKNAEARDDISVSNEDTGEEIEAEVDTDQAFYTEESSYPDESELSADTYGNYSSESINLYG